MEHSNHTTVTEFIMQGIFDHPHHEGLFFGLFLCLYTAVFMGNFLIIVVIVIHPPLHTPMYFFITNLALVDILCTSSVVPKRLENLMQEKKTISFGGCITQLFVFTLSLVTELLLLTVMSYDCSTYLNGIMMFMADIFLAMENFLLTTVSYSFIIITILKIQSSKGKQRTFSTCSSHLLVFTLYYSTIIYIYILPTSSYSSYLDKDKMVATMYTLVTLTLNPLIYSLHNKEVKVVTRKIFLFTNK